MKENLFDQEDAKKSGAFPKGQTGSHLVKLYLM